MKRRDFIKAAACVAAFASRCGSAAGAADERPLRGSTLPPAAEAVLFGGSAWKLHMYTGRTTDISLSTLFRSPSGRLVMIDGGWGADGEFLLGELKRFGGVVDTWFLTHAHRDHYRALGEILKKPRFGGLKIGRVVLDFLPLDFIAEVSPSSLQHVKEFLGDLAKSGLKVERPAVGRVYDFGEGLSFECLNSCDLSMRRDAINNSSICYRVMNAGSSILVTGDVGEEMGAKMVRELPREKLKSDVCFMAHHGQAGANKEFYAAVRPEACIWPTPQWLWDNDLAGENGPGSGPFLTNYTKCWMQELGVKRQFLLTRDWVLS
ncbi:MAG: MBL fold metallo-hydrolase [Kiritimatiellae bacterium]|nr:MBL fold metallo-hydrolase [Kiritimatiellia bacterium]